MPHPPNHRDEPMSLSLRELIREIVWKATRLARKEVDLARAEFAADLQAELSVAKGLAVAALVALLSLNAFVMAAILGLATVMPGWLAALVVAAALLAIGAVIGGVSWARRVKSPLALTRSTLRETVQWAKERLA